MRKALIAALLCGLAAVRADALINRTLTGTSITANGVGITGSLRCTPTGTMPSSVGSGVLAPIEQSYTITTGSITCGASPCTIAAPAAYTCKLYSGSSLVLTFRTSVSDAVATAITMTDLYQAGQGSPVVAADDIQEGDLLTLLTAPAGTTDGYVATVQADGTTIAFEAVPVSAGDIASVTAGDGLTGGGTTGAVTLAVGAGTGITVAADTVSVASTQATDTEVSTAVSDHAGAADPHTGYRLESETIGASEGGTGANLSGTGPGLVQQTTLGGALSVSDTINRAVAINQTTSGNAIPLWVTATSTGNASNNVAGIFYAITEHTGTNPNNAYGLFATAQTKHNSPATLVLAEGGNFVAHHEGTGSILSMYGAYNEVDNTSSGAVTYGKATRSVAAVTGTGAMTNLMAYHGSINQLNAGSTIGTAYGLNLSEWQKLGTINTSYGIYMDTSIDVGTTKYAIYSTSTSPSTLAGTLAATQFTGPATALKSATTSIDVSAATAPTIGQVLTGVDTTHATWQTPATPATPTLAQVTAAGASTATATTFTGTLTRGVPVTPDATASSVFAAQSATDTPIVAIGAAGQSVPLQEWQVSDGSLSGHITQGGLLALNNAAVVGATLRLDSGTTPIAKMSINNGTGEIALGSTYATYFLNLYSGNALALKLTTTGNAEFGGGYGSTGVTISGAGAISADGATISASYTANTASDTDFDNAEVLSTGLGASYGTLIVRDSVGGVSGHFRLENTSVYIISANVVFTTTKDTGASFNVYYETGAFRVQNTVGDNKNVKVGFFGL